MSDPRDIRDAISQYARAYARLEALQVADSLLPRGDQKTGSIGEFYARVHLESLYPAPATIRYGGHSNKSWDFEISQDDSVRRIQVKAVSAYSVSRVLSPIHHGADELWVFSLDSHFQPNGFWIVAPPPTAGAGPRRGVRAPDPATSRVSRGSVEFGPNRVAELHIYAKRSTSQRVR